MGGNQISEGRALMLDTLEPSAPRAVRLEGAGFFVHGRVAVKVANRVEVRAVVRGARHFDVAIATAESGRLAATCDCVTFREEPAVCRHLWATLIKIQNEGLLEEPAPIGPPASAGTM